MKQHQKKETQSNNSGSNKYMAASVNSQMLIQLMDNKEMGHDDIQAALNQQEGNLHAIPNYLSSKDINIINNFMDQ